MNVKRVWILLKNEIFHGPKDAVLVMSLVMPALLALFVNLAFGNIFSDRAKLGVYDAGNSPLVATLDSNQSLALKVYKNEEELRGAAANGNVDIGIILPTDFDSTLSAGTIRLKAYIWGESLAKNRAVVPVALADAIHQFAGATLPVVVDTVPLGDASSLPWSNRLLPLTVLMAVFFGGMMLPASSLINEKQRRTLQALNVTPATIGNVFWSKGILGAVLAIFMGVITLAISGSFGGTPLGIVLVLGLGAIMAAEIGLLAGAFIKDINTLYAFWKFGGLLLFGPAIVFMFPQIPAWLGYIFPTFYVIKPVVDLSITGDNFGAAALYVVVLAAIVAVMGLIVISVVKRLSAQALRLT